MWGRDCGETSKTVFVGISGKHWHLSETTQAYSVSFRLTLLHPSPSVRQDRAERAARYAKTQEEEKAAKQALRQTRLAEQEVRKETLVRERR